MLTLTPQVFGILSSLIEARCGMHYLVEDAELLAAKASTRLVERGFHSFLDYYYFLRYDPEGPAELDMLVETLVVHETYFFREHRQLEALVTEYLVPRIARGRRVRVWCAAAATGEEPLTLAMMLAARDLLPHVEIHATDVSERAIGQARAGLFNRRAMRNVPDGYGRWLRVEGEAAVIDPALIDVVKWGRANLLVPNDFEPLGKLDAILCRNVLIYFRDETIAKTVDSLVARLLPDGVLVVGVSESLMRIGTSLRCEERGGAFFYEKVAS